MTRVIRRPPEKLDAQMTANVRLHFFQFLRSLLRFGSGWSANHALQRFDGFGKPGEGFSGAKGLVNNQTESAGADEPTVPRRERRGCRWNNRSAAPLGGCYRCVPCADGTKTKLHRSADAGSLS